jgi:hypothetical protein
MLAEQVLKPLAPSGRLPAGADCALYVISNVAIHRRPGLPQAPEEYDKWGKRYRALRIPVAIAGIGLLAFAVYTNPIVLLIVAAAVALVAVVATALTGSPLPDFDWLDKVLRAVHIDEIGSEFEWHSAPFERLIETLVQSSRPQQGSDPARCLILSGDVHASYAMRLSYFEPRTQPRALALLAQLTGSPAKYRPTKTGSYGPTSKGKFAGFRNMPATTRPAVPTAAKVLKQGDPWVFDIGPGQPGPWTIQPDYAYVIEPVVPTGPPAVSFNPPQATTFPQYLASLNEHQAEALGKIAASSVVESNNVADVTFTGSPTDRKAIQEIVWFWRTQHIVTKYEVSLNPDPPPNLPP